MPWNPKKDGLSRVAASTHGSHDGMLSALRHLGEVRAYLDEREAHHVGGLRRAGVTWKRIGAALGTSGQAVSMRYRGRL